MKADILVYLLFCITSIAIGQTDQALTGPIIQPPAGPITLVVHGGAGTILRENMTPELEEAYTSKLRQAMDTGYVVLSRGGAAVDAVVAAIKILEDSPLFNAGKGAVFTHDGKNELDASIMDGASLAAGAVAAVTSIKNPIAAAHAVMKNSPHVLLAGEGAEKFAAINGLEIVDSSYFYTESRYKSLLEIQKRQEQDGSGEGDQPEILKWGTVGVLALDDQGNLAAGTSTGGMTNKMFGRIGDTPVIGAGTYADNRTCAVSSTGHGEYFIRKVVAYDIAAKMKYAGMKLQDACKTIIHEELPVLGGSGGVIALDREGNISMVFNTPGMYRGFMQQGKEPFVAIYR